jgi:hypothetical protein
MYGSVVGERDKSNRMLMFDKHMAHKLRSGSTDVATGSRRIGRYVRLVLKLNDEALASLHTGRKGYSHETGRDIIERCTFRRRPNVGGGRKVRPWSAVVT